MSPLSLMGFPLYYLSTQKELILVVKNIKGMDQFFPQRSFQKTQMTFAFLIVQNPKVSWCVS